MSEPAPTPDDDETLVAYLDGQLPAEECERIESRLATDESTRLRVRELDLVWDALDALPRTTASASFTQTTVDMAALGSSESNTLAPKRRLPWRSLAVGIGGLACGVLIALLLSGSGDRRALRSLPTALHASALENAGSVEFLAGLVERRSGAFGGRLADDARSDAQEWAELDSADVAERRAWLTALPPGRVDEVALRVEAFRDATPGRRDALLRLDREISEHPLRDELRTAALAYDSLVATLSAGDQARLRGLSVEDRLEEAGRKASFWMVREALRLSDSERDDLEAAIDALVEDEGFATAIERLPRKPSPRLFFMGLTREVALGRIPPPSPPGEVRPGGPPVPWEEMRRWARQLFAQWPDWATRLEAALPEDAREQLAAAKNNRSRARRWLLVFSSATSEGLADEFADLPNDQMERVLLLPVDELTETLEAASEPGRPRGRRGMLFDPRFFGPPPGGEGPPGRPPGRPRGEGRRRGSR